MHYQISQLQCNDLPEVSQLYMDAYSNSTWNEKWDYTNAHQRISELTSSSFILALVCRLDDRIVGCIILEILAWHTGKQMEIKELFVSPKYRNLGIGNRLVKQAEEIAKMRGVNEICLWTSTTRQLVSFYTRMGYCQTTELIRFSKNV